MCTEILVCHGEKVDLLKKAYSKDHIKRVRKDSNPAVYYITKDGKYAIDADFVSKSDWDTLDLKNVPKIALK